MQKTRKELILEAGIFKDIIPQLFPDIPTQSGQEQILVCCPFHGDKNPSLSVNTVQGLFHCFACGAKGNGFDLYMQVKDCDFKTALQELEAVAGITKDTPRKKVFPKVVATYTYHDANGKPRYCKKRYEPSFDGKRKKAFSFYHRPEGKREEKGRGGVAVPYNLHQLATLPKGEPIFFLEGEAKADILARWGLCATSLDSGGQSGKGASWRNEWSKYFAGREVYILPDNDKTGEEYARSLAEHLLPVASTVKALRLPNLPPKGDIIDWVRREGASK